MSAAVAHRGPDGAGAVELRPGGRAAPVGLAHRRLAIIDLSAEGAQPMAAPCPRCGSESIHDLALTYNGEIYNFAELREDLRARGHAFHSGTDSEVLLHLYAERGMEMLPLLNGIYAFAICDGRERGRPEGVERGDLLMARDPLGVKPLYHAQLPGGFVFASELKALLPVPGLPRDLDPVAIHHHLAYLWAPAPRTMLKAVAKLPPGHALLVRGGRVAREWSHDPAPFSDPRLAGSESEVAAMLRDEVQAAVGRQMVSDVPVGAFLSGGLDSSAVVAMMRRVRPDGPAPVCYTMGLGDERMTDGNPADLPYARRVAQHLGVDLRVVEVDSSMIRHLERMLWLLDEPQADPAPINALLIAERARADGIPVLLSGAGGDDIFSGYRRHVALRAERLWGWMPRAARAAIARPARHVHGGAAGGMHHPLARRAAKALAYADYDADRRMASYFWWSGEELRRSLYSPALARELEGTDTAEPLLRSLERIPHERDPLNRMLYLETRHFLADHNLNYTDKTGMASGVEVRVPLLDRELVRFAGRVPPAMKQKGREGKAIFKRAMEPLLPREVIYRGKSGFGAPLRSWLRGELRGRVEETLSPAALRERGLFDPAAVRRLVEMDRQGRVDGAYTIFALMCVELWCRMFVDAAAPAGARAA
jgi:asparagine synthase (glutamine-hydrolysing)